MTTVGICTMGTRAICQNATTRLSTKWKNGRRGTGWPGNLTFPFTVSREEDEDDANFAEGAAKAPFRLGHKMEVLELTGEDVDQGIMVKVREKGQIGYVPLADLEVSPKTDASLWPVQEYVVWFANRC